jgi:P27 family predicted phage terminase small subunit
VLSQNWENRVAVMTRGRRAEPTALKLVKGTRKSRINTSEPKPVVSRVVAPPMSRKARTVWNRLAPDMIAKRVLTAWDSDLMVGYCESVVIARESAADIAKRGPLVTGARGGMVRNPSVTIHREANATMVRLASMLGIGAAERSRLHVDASSATPGGASGRFFTGPKT